MDWKLFLGTFLTVFLAEMGDKTQFAALAISSQSRATNTILIAVILALALAGALGVFAGRLISTWIDPKLLRYASGIIFVTIGLWMIFFGKVNGMK